MSDLSIDSLYQDILLDHQQDPRNFGEMNDANRKFEGFNPVCGDRVVVYLKVNGEQIEEAKFTGEGCSICMASASMMTEEIQKKSTSQVLNQVQDFRKHMQGEATETKFDGDLKALDGVKRFPVRMKCAILPWTTLKEAIEKGAST